MGLRQVEPKVVELDGMNFYIRPFPAFKAANITGELTNVLTPLFGMLVPLIEDDKDLGDVDANKAAKAMSSCPSISGDQWEKLMRKLILGGHISVEYEDEEGQKHAEVLDSDLSNEVFCGNVQNMFVLCFYVIRINFKGFFDKFLNRFGKLKSVQDLLNQNQNDTEDSTTVSSTI